MEGFRKADMGYLEEVAILKPKGAGMRSAAAAAQQPPGKAFPATITVPAASAAGVQHLSGASDGCTECC